MLQLIIKELFAKEGIMKKTKIQRHLDTLEVEDLARKVYCTDEESAVFAKMPPQDLPADVYSEKEQLSNGRIGPRYFRYEDIADSVFIQAQILKQIRVNRIFLWILIIPFIITIILLIVGIVIG